MDAAYDKILLFELTIGVFEFVFFRMHFNTGGTQREQAFLVLAEVVDHFFGVEGAGFRNVD